KAVVAGPANENVIAAATLKAHGRVGRVGACVDHVGKFRATDCTHAGEGVGANIRDVAGIGSMRGARARAGHGDRDSGQRIQVADALVAIACDDVVAAQSFELVEGRPTGVHAGAAGVGARGGEAGRVEDVGEVGAAHGLD